MAKANVANTLVVPSESKVYPYYDDFNEDKNFKRILFRPGYAVQARELTQLQTILQNQIERFGQHIFENGSPVLGGEILWDPTKRLATINLESTYNNTELAVSVFKNRTITLTTPNADNVVRFQVVQVSPANDTEPPALVGSFVLGQISDLPDGSTIMTKIDNNNSDIFYANLTPSLAVTGSASAAMIKDSVYFFNGYFIKVPSQSAIVSKYGAIDEINLSLGLEFNDNIITEISDSSLLDPAQESFNYQAPGAARYVAELTLSTRPLDSIDKSKFVELARIEKGILRKLVQYPMYSEIEEVLARRTYDESGNYTVRPFVLNMEEDSVDPVNYVSARLSAGKAYVYGYEFETIAPTDVRIPRARTKANVTNYSLNMNYGNYVIVDGVNGVFDTIKMPQIDIHCIPANSPVSNASLAAYNSTKIGTARLKDINFYSGDTDVTTRKYELYITDIQFRTISSNANVVPFVTQTNMVQFWNVSVVSANTFAYRNATLKIDSGQGAGYSYNIASSGSNGRIFLTTNLIEPLAANSNVSINFDFSDAESFVVSPHWGAGSPTYGANANISLLNKIGGDPNADAFITESTMDTLLFPLPENYVANGIYNSAYQYRRRFDSVTFTAGSSAGSPIAAASFGGTPLEEFIGANATSNIASTIMNNFYVVVTGLGAATTRTVGEVLKVTTTVTGSPETVTFNTGTVSDNVTATVFAKMQYKPNTAPKLKTLVLANTKTLATETANTFTNGPTGSNVAIYLDSGQTVITKPSRRAGESESLYVSDVISVQKIYDLAGATPTAGMDLTGYTDVTSRYLIDSGQRESFYDHASISLKHGYAPCTGPLVACYRYYKHTQPTNSGGYFIVDSYPELANTVFEEGTAIGTGYDLIPNFISKSGNKVSLRDCIDFRPTKTNATNTYPSFAYTFNGYTTAPITSPLPATDFDLSYQYYMGRKDLIVLKADKSFARIEGIPSKYPQEPPVPARSMVLYALTATPYTASPSNVNVRYVENKRYTMRDIGKIEKRVENLEYYVQLNSLEQSAVNQPIRDVDGLDRTKYGIFADSFVGHSLGNSDLFDYACAMKFDTGWLQCKTKTLGFDLIANTELSSGVTFYRDKVLLQNVEVPWLYQDVASKWSPLAEYMFAAFNGKIFCVPEADIWKSIHKAPDIISVDNVEREHVNFDVQVIQDPNGTFYDTIVDSGSRSGSTANTITKSITVV